MNTSNILSVPFSIVVIAIASHPCHHAYGAVFETVVVSVLRSGPVRFFASKMGNWQLQLVAD